MNQKEDDPSLHENLTRLDRYVPRRKHLATAIQQMKSPNKINRCGATGGFRAQSVEDSIGRGLLEDAPLMQSAYQTNDLSAAKQTHTRGKSLAETIEVQRRSTCKVSGYNGVPYNTISRLARNEDFPNHPYLSEQKPKESVSKSMHKRSASEARDSFYKSTSMRSSATVFPDLKSSANNWVKGTMK